MTQEVQDVPVGSIRVEARYRQDLGDLTELVESIRAKGIIQPITIDTESKLLAGGRRLEAAKQAGLEVVPCLVRRVTDDTDRLEIELFENIYRKDMTWPERARLEKAIYDLKKESDPKWSMQQQADATDISKSLVSRRLQLAEYIEAVPELANIQTEDQAWKAAKKMEEAILRDALVSQAQSKGLKGLKIADKNFKIGDAFEGISRLADGAYRFADIDPPYAVELDKRKGRNIKSDTQMESYTEWSPAEYVSNISNLASEMYRIMADHSFCIWWFGHSWYQDTLASIREAGFIVSDIPAIWIKSGSGQTASPDTMLGSAYEPFFVCRKGEAKLCKPGRSNVFSFSPVPPQRKIHPTEKPIDLMVELMATFCWPGTRCVIPFLGSGVSIRAAFATGNIAFGWDLSKRHKAGFLGRVREDIEAGLYQETGAMKEAKGGPPKDL